MLRGIPSMLPLIRCRVKPLRGAWHLRHRLRLSPLSKTGRPSGARFRGCGGTGRGDPGTTAEIPTSAPWTRRAGVLRSMELPQPVEGDRTFAQGSTGFPASPLSPRDNLPAVGPLGGTDSSTGTALVYLSIDKSLNVWKRRKTAVARLLGDETRSVQSESGLPRCWSHENWYRRVL